MTDSEDVPVGPPDIAQPGNLDPKTAALQQTAQSHPQLSQGSREAHAGHGKQAGTGGWHHSQVTHLRGCRPWLCAELEQILSCAVGTSISQVLSSDAQVRVGRGDLQVEETRDIVFWHHEKLHRKTKSWEPKWTQQGD